jgi:hypothetical protein
VESINELSYEKAAQVFKEIQKIPYHISLSSDDACYDCVGKNSMLAQGLIEIGYKVRARTGFFKWSDLSLPEEMLKIPHDNDCSHYFIEVIPPGKDKWVLLDATWNQELEKAGFPISKWDGFSATVNALPCAEILDAKLEEEYEESINWEEDLEKNREFYKAFNDYCDSFIRQGAKNG